MGSREDTSTKRSKFQRFLDNDPIEVLSASILSARDKDDCVYRLLVGVVRVLWRRDCGVAPIAVFCLFLGVVGAKSSSSLSFVSTYYKARS